MKLSKFSFAKTDPSLSEVATSDKALLKKIKRTLSILVLLILCHILAMIILESMTPWQALWLTLTTITTVGYGDVSAQTSMGQAATIIIMFVLAITLLTILVRDYIDYRIARSERIRSGLWKWKMEQHIVIINAPKYNADRFFERLVSQIREDEEYKSTDILLLNHEYQDGLPAILKDLRVKHMTGSASNDRDLNNASINNARHIMVLSRDEYHGDSDSISFDIAYRLNQRSLGHICLVECVDDNNRTRLKDLGMKSIMRPIRSYPEILVRALDAPGSEQVIEDMFTRRDDHTERYSLWLEGERWADVVTAMIQGGIGTPMAYVSKEGDVHVHPDSEEHVHGQSLIIFVKSSQMPSEEKVKQAFSQYFSKQISTQPVLGQSEPSR